MSMNLNERFQAFAAKTPHMTGSVEQFEDLEIMGVDAALIALGRAHGGSLSAVPIGRHPSVTRGFVEAWIADQKRQDARRLEGLSRMQSISSIASAVAAVASAVVAVAALVIQRAN